ncbi:MAG TPA: fumarylacetoacetate hydrolase family protein [Candidatus Hydrogenedentes bacterium]|nr:fumarylacetoacetate hydrolase family protein [Candidatus Hydrogenedentota bacterium]
MLLRPYTKFHEYILLHITIFVNIYWNSYQPIPQSPIFFTKAASAICGATDDVVYPADTLLLDYEIELGVVLGRTVGKKDVITHENLADYVLGITLFNDISARDLQLRAGQWFLGKSYRTFAPLGPFIQRMDQAAQSRLYDLTLELDIYAADGTNPSGKGQKGTTAQMIFRVHELLNCLRKKLDLLPGDVVATGTPCGVALGSPPKYKMRLAEIIGMPQAERIEHFISSEVKDNRRYLSAGDIMKTRIYSRDGAVDLGQQSNRIIRDETTI